MDRLDNGVWRGCQETVDEVRSGDRHGLGAPIAFELGPDAREGEQRAVLVEREPNGVPPMPLQFDPIS